MSEGDSFESDEDVDDEITSGVALGESAVESLIEMSERLEISGVDGASEELPSLAAFLHLIHNAGRRLQAAFYTFYRIAIMLQ